MHINTPVSYTHLDVYKRQGNNSYQSNIIRTDLSKESMEEDDSKAVRPETGLTEVRINIEGKEVTTLVDTGSEVCYFRTHAR